MSLETFRKNGTAVPTPVWLAVVDGDKLVVVTATTSWKVKRLRNNPAVRVAPCDMRGAVAPDARWEEGACEILDPASPAERAAHAALRTTYGWQMALADLGAALRRLFTGDDNRTYLQITLKPKTAG